MNISKLASVAAAALALGFCAAPFAYAAAPTAVTSNSIWSVDTLRTQPAGKVITTIGDISVTVAGTSTSVLPVAAGTGIATCEGFTTLAAQLQRATVDPYGANSTYVTWSSYGSALAANGTTAITETGLAWFRWNITALTGSGNCVISAASQ